MDMDAKTKDSAIYQLQDLYTDTGAIMKWIQERSPRPDLVAGELGGMLDRLSSIGHLFGFGRNEIIAHLQRQEEHDAAAAGQSWRDVSGYMATPVPVGGNSGNGMLADL